MWLDVETWLPLLSMSLAGAICFGVARRSLFVGGLGSDLQGTRILPFVFSLLVLR
jgi:hypothetical protein